MNQELANGEVSGILYGVSENDCITQKLFKEWFLCHFLAFLSLFYYIRPVLLLIDGHLNHYCQETF